MAEHTEQPAVVVLVVPTARRIGAQLRASGGWYLSEVRRVIRTLTDPGG